MVCTAPVGTKPVAIRESDEADDGSRTRDLKLGKLALYQLSYVRVVGRLQIARRDRYPAAAIAQARAKTASSIASVSLPVKVFC